MDVLISGASIAGPALAYWLRRYGYSVTVVERGPELRPGGQGIDIRGAGRTVVERMGLMRPIKAAHAGVRGLSYVDGDGRVVAEMPMDEFGDSGGIVADIEILRGDLSRILYDAAPAEYLFGDSIAALSDTEAGVDVAFESGLRRRFDLVIGADGIGSNTRRLAFPGNAWRIEDSGYHRAVFNAGRLMELGDTELMYNAPAGNGTTLGRVALLYPAHGEVRVQFAFGCPPIEYDRADIAAQKRIVADVYAGLGWRVPDMLAAMERADDFYFDRPGKLAADRWYHGRVALLGDACTAGSVGMGTSMALVGAYVLAGELAAAGGDHRVGYPAYQAAMREFVAANMKPMPGGVKGFLPPTERAIRMRNGMMRLMLKTPMKRLMMGGMDKAVNAISLRDYPVPVGG